MSKRTTAANMYEYYFKDTFEIYKYVSITLMRLYIPKFYTHLNLTEYWYATPISYRFLIYLFDE